MEYREAIAWIIDRAGYDKGFVANPFAGDEVAALGLRRTAGLLRRLESPERAYRIVHVAGTKGKGSTCATVAAVARGGGLSTGLYVTPHLHTFRERFLIDGEPLSEAEFAAVADLVAPADLLVEAEEPEIGEPTAFEIATAMALLAFQRAAVDLAVVEVGLGGRLDATNVVTPDVAAISTISYDHTAILGTTLEEIAFEKGGIIKPSKPVAVGPQPAEALAELRRIAAERSAPLFLAGRDWQTASNGDGATLTGPWGDWRNVQLALAGPHQVENAGLALMTLWLFDSRLLADEGRVREALAGVRWPGRFERISMAPAIYVDGAHNVNSIERLAATIGDHLEGGVLHVVLGIGRDKDIGGMLRALAPLEPRITATASHNPRAAAPDQIAAAAIDAGLAAATAPNVAAALDDIRATAGSADTILVTGSLYAVAEAREALGLAETPVFERELLY
ncbi:MAG TPA: folylpolyglutamate synthase/dihydrofolate synthase family protein [Thermomicrobiales bacterium]|nr:folylpolyglutamate synthase/dihydrofolate synthase family protein [Thermomicrobiales bacterium]